jgi:phage recombination protein Bet
METETTDTAPDADVETTDVVLHEGMTGTLLVRWSSSQRQMLADLIAPGITPEELDLFEQVCLQTGLSPFAKQIYAIHRNKREKDPSGRWITRKVMTVQTSIDGFRLIAQRTGRYRGQTAQEWCGPDGRWTDVWLREAPPVAARVGVYASGFAEPLVRVALWKEFAPLNDKGEPTGQWRSMPSLMLAKTAESAALRAAFPAELSGIYTDEEMGQADRPYSGPTGNPEQATPTGEPGHHPSGWSDLTASLKALVPWCDWPATIREIGNVAYNAPTSAEMSKESKDDLFVRLIHLADALPDAFPPPDEDALAGYVAEAFDGVLVEPIAIVEPVAIPETVEPEVTDAVESGPEEIVDAEVVEPEASAPGRSVDDVDF